MNRDLCIICASSFRLLKVSRFCWVWQVFSYLFLFIHMKPNRVLESSTSWELSGKLVEKCWQNSIPFEMMFRRTDDNISTDHDDQGSHVWHHGITLTAFTGNFHTVIWIYYILHAETTSACKWNMFWHPQTTADEWVEGARTAPVSCCRRKRAVCFPAVCVSVGAACSTCRRLKWLYRLRWWGYKGVAVQTNTLSVWATDPRCQVLPLSPSSS